LRLPPDRVVPPHLRGILKDEVPLLLADKDLLGEIVEKPPILGPRPFLLLPRVGALAVFSGLGAVSGAGGNSGGLGGFGNTHI
tara:strand:- start:124 stop:372 length:249 start_codon:yes stop_codon:yes gene_type:complete